MMTNKAFFTAFLLLLLWSLSLAPVRSQPEKVYKITPARSIGQFAVGQDIEKVEKIFGKPDFIKTLAKGTLVKFDTPGMIVQYDTFSGEILFLGVSKAQYRGHRFVTGDGLCVGETKTSVERLYGKPDSMVDVTTRDAYPDSDKMAIYAGRGISFHYDKEGRILIIMVFPPSIFGG